MHATRSIVRAAAARVAAPLIGTSLRAFSAAASPSADFTLRVPLKGHLIEPPALPKVSVTKDEMMNYFREMYTIRRMEIACDTEYKNRKIRGFCHLYDGQEAVAMGIQSALDKRDNVTTSYRCHAIQYIRGDSVKRIVAELFGFQEGSSMGKGGSMHFYSKKNRMWGGSGIVGAQVPVGVGIAFADQFLARNALPLPVTIVMYGDGAANQGQLYEAWNMAALWKVPAIFLCENNEYGMGTSTARSSANPEYYKAGGVVTPGIQCDGMDVLAVREAVRACKAHAGGGRGPIFLEMKTYRYHGHSMSDPGITYRDRDEVASMRAARDCIEQTKARIVEAGWATPDELKAMEKDIRAAVTAEVEDAKKGSLPNDALLFEHILHNEKPKFVRGAEFQTSKYF